VGGASDKENNGADTRYDYWSFEQEGAAAKAALYELKQRRKS